MERWRITVSGLVQGVGFRPFVYNLAREIGVTGWVRNNFAGMEIEVQGEKEALETFRNVLPEQAPKTAKIDALALDIIEARPDETSFEIRPSEPGELLGSPLPDQGICDDCLAEFHDSRNRRHLYPFNSCVICGPRFTIIEKLPYDRQRTSMGQFPLCPSCNAEYADPSDRRFHAQTVSCPECGPTLWFTDSSGHKKEEDPNVLASSKLENGEIIAVKGVGGWHLACNAYNESAVKRLRGLKERDNRAFAVLYKDMESLKRDCLVEPMEASVLNDPSKPIVLLRQTENSRLAPSVNPGLKEVGAFLPYTAIQMALFSQKVNALVMTSGNRSGEPLTIDDSAAFKDLSRIVSGFLGHNRAILWRCDDSVVRVQNRRTIGIRRSRGYAPAPVRLNRELPPLLACGAQQKNVFALTKGKNVYLSAHQGDLDHLSACLEYQETIERFRRLIDCNPRWAVHDLHPDYFSTGVAKKSGLETIGVQHHVAHLAGVIAQNRLEGDVIGVAMDGSGYGTDGRIWGGEFFVGSECSWLRAAHLQYYSLPGGEAAIREPWRIAASYLARKNAPGFNEWLAKYGLEFQWRTLRTATEKGINSPETSSMGRLFDGVASLVGGILKVSYEGEAAIWLENQAVPVETGSYHYDIKLNNDIYQVDPGDIAAQVLEDMPRRSIGEISMKFHRTMASVISDTAALISKETSLKRVLLSGGVFQNRLLTDLTWRLLESKGFEVIIPEIVPINDGGIALGQAWLGGLMIERGIDNVFSGSR